MKNKSNLIFLDTETTGTDLKEDYLCQVAYKFNGKMTVKNFKPIIPISLHAMSVTHITNKMVENEEPFKDSDTYNDLKKILKDNILVAHNAKFDIAMLKNDGLEVPRFICTLKLVRYLDENQDIESYKLQYLRYYYDILEMDVNPHSADGDVLVLEAVFEKLYEEAKSKASDSSYDAIIERMLDISSKPSLIKKINFGKYKDSLIRDIALSDRGYLEWLLREKKKDPDGEEDWIYTLEYFLYN